MTLPREKKIWLFAFSISVLFHALFFAIGAKLPKKTPELPIVVKLVEKEAAAAKLSNVGQRSPLPEKRAVARQQKQERSQKAPVAAKADKKVLAQPKNKAQEAQPVQAAAASAVSGNGHWEGSGESSGGQAQGSGNGAPGGHGTGNATGEIVDVGTLVITKKVTPQYPAFSRKRKEEGTVQLLITISENSVSECKIEKSSGYERLDEAARRAVLQWKFSHNGNVRARVPVVFKISD